MGILSYGLEFLFLPRCGLLCSLPYLAAPGIHISVLQNPLTSQSVKQLIADGDKEELQKCFGARMEFGTAGLRAPMGAGVSRMNDLTIIQTTQVTGS